MGVTKGVKPQRTWEPATINLRVTVTTQASAERRDCWTHGPHYECHGGYESPWR